MPICDNLLGFLWAWQTQTPGWVRVVVGQVSLTRTRTYTHPYDTEASAAAGSARAHVARESKHKEAGRQVRWAQGRGDISFKPLAF